MPQNVDLARAQALLKMVAEDLKLPLMQIARQTELASITGITHDEVLEFVRLSAGSAIDLVDSYLLGLELAGRQQSLPLTPVAIGSVLYESAHKLNATAKRYGVDLAVEITPACQPVMASPEALKVAIFSLGVAFIEALPSDTEKPRLTLAAHRTGSGLVAGVYSPLVSVASSQLHKTGMLNNWMRQPLSQFSHGSSAGVFIARAILESMSSRLRTAHYHKQAGLAAVLQPSYQLELV